MAGIFISYRQADAKAWAIGLRDDLAKVFGDDQVFLDKDALGPGNWREQLQRALKQCPIVLVVIGRQWLNITDEEARPRITLSDDVHRQEIALALNHPGVTVIPILVDEAMMPKSDKLPEDIRGLTNQQAFKIGDTKVRRKADLDMLVQGIVAVGGLVPREPIGDKNQNKSPEDKSPWYKPDLQVVAIACMFTTIIYIVTYLIDGQRLGDQEISGWLILSYILALIGKVLWRRASR